MGTKLSPHNAELYQRVDEVLHYIWDPIGVRDMPMARDDNNDDEIAEYLVYVATTGWGFTKRRNTHLKSSTYYRTGSELLMKSTFRTLELTEYLASNQGN